MTIDLAELERLAAEFDAAREDYNSDELNPHGRDLTIALRLDDAETALGKALVSASATLLAELRELRAIVASAETMGVVPRSEIAAVKLTEWIRVALDEAAEPTKRKKPAAG